MNFNYIDFETLKNKKDFLSTQWKEAKPFSYICFDDFFNLEMAEKILSSYPSVENKHWENTTYINQKNKFVKTDFNDLQLFNEVYSELNNEKFLSLISNITGIENLVIDENLFGAGLHQSINGAFLDVHVDFNIHPKTKHYRRMNILIYMNKDWKKEYNGYLELWDMEKKVQIDNIEPKFNRCVIFETNEISFHGHPKPLNTPNGISRKSISAYYYTKEHPINKAVSDHNTIYVNTEGSKGLVKNFISGVKALKERFVK